MIKSVAQIDPQWRKLLSPLLLAEAMDPSWQSTRHHRVIDYEFRRLLAPGNPCDMLIITCPPRHGKQVAHETPVWTPNGWRRHGDLKPGDEVYAPDGSYTEVIGISKENRETDHLVTFTDGAQVLCHARHEWVVYDRKKRRTLQAETAELLQLGLGYGVHRDGASRARFQLGWTAPIQEDESPLPLHPYMLGVWLGDGKTTGGTICGSPVDMSFICGRLSGLGYVPSSGWTHDGTGVRYEYFSGMVQVLRSINVFGDKHIPQQYFRASINQRRELLAGLVDTDGSVEEGGRVRFVSCSWRLAQDVMTLVRTLGYRASVSVAEPELSSSGIQGNVPVFSVQWSPHDGVAQGRLPRKRGEFRCMRRRRSIASIEIVPGQLGRCIEVAHPSGMYLVGREMLPTHNSTYLSHWAPSHYLLRNPYRRVMLCSYGMRLAKWLSRRVRDRVHSCAKLFGIKGVNPGIAAADEWELDGTGGGMLASGVEGSITGRGADLILIDDYIRKGKDAASQTVRDSQWEWMQSTVSTRREPGAKIVILACLTESAMVWMADGSHRSIRDVQPGDQVYSFREGELCTAKVVVNCCVGNDDVFQVRLASGKTVTGNGHHPFLVETEGALKWIQMKNLSSTMRIVTARGSGESGKAIHADGKGATRRQSAGATVHPTIRKSDVSMATRLRRKALVAGESRSTNTATALQSKTTSECSGSKTASVRAAVNRQRKKTCIEESRGLLSITTTNPELFAGYSVRTAILPQEDLKPTPPPLALLDTSNFTLDSVVEVLPMGRDLVYDLQVEGTQAFVANGLVTHNTPWHDDDLIGRIMNQREELGLNVRRIALQAIRENDGTPDPLGREFGQALWPERWSEATLEKQKKLMGPYWWQAQYQGVPGTYGRNEWPASYFSNIWAQDDEWPVLAPISTVALDPSKGAHDDHGDYQALCYVAFHKGILWMDFDVDRRPIPDMMRQMAKFCYERRPGLVGIESNAWQELLAEPYLKACADQGYHVTEPSLMLNTVSKLVRIMRLATYFDAKAIKVRRNAGGEEFIRQAKAFPNGEHDDALDAAEMAIRLLTFYLTGEWGPEDEATILAA